MSVNQAAASDAPPVNRWTQLIVGIICMVMIANLQYGWTYFVDPIDAKRRPGSPRASRLIWVGLDQHGAGAVGQHEPQKLLVEAQVRALGCGGVDPSFIGRGVELRSSQRGGGQLRSGHHGRRRKPGEHRGIPVLHCGHPRAAHPGRRNDLTGRAAEQPMNHRRYQNGCGGYDTPEDSSSKFAPLRIIDRTGMKRFECHPADRTKARPFLANFRMHRAVYSAAEGTDAGLSVRNRCGFRRKLSAQWGLQK